MNHYGKRLGRALAALFVGIATLLAVGCDSTDNDFFTGTGFDTGSLAYFLRVNNVTSVPNGTTTLRFDLYDDSTPANGNLVLTLDAALADTVTLTELPTSVRSTVVTAFDGNGFPIGQVTVNSQVVGGSAGQVDLSNVTFTAITFDSLTAAPDPVGIANQETQQLALTAAFSNGATAQLNQSTFATAAGFQSANTNVATVSNDGEISVAAAGNTTVTATYTINGVSRSDTVTVNTSVFDVAVNIVNARTNFSELDDFNVSVGTSFQPTYLARLTGPDGQTATVAVSEVSFAFQPAVAGFSVTSSGEVTVASTVTGGTTANLVASYTDSSNRTYSDTLVVTALDNI